MIQSDREPLRCLTKLAIGFFSASLALVLLLLIASIVISSGSNYGSDGSKNLLMSGAAAWLACLVIAGLIWLVDSLIQSGIQAKKDQQARWELICKDRVSDTQTWQLATCPEQMLRRLIAQGLVSDEELRRFTCACILMAKEPHNAETVKVIRFATSAAGTEPGSPEAEEREELEFLAKHLDHFSAPGFGFTAPLCPDAGQGASWAIYSTQYSHCGEEMYGSRKPELKPAIDAKLCGLLREMFADRFVDGPCW